MANQHVPLNCVIDQREPAVRLCRKATTTRPSPTAEDVIRLNPNHILACNNLAWLLAVHPDANGRNGAKAVKYATKACELSEWKTPPYFDTLAAAYAEAGDFGNAVKWQTRYLESDHLKSNPSKDASEKARQRLSLYEQKQPNHEEEPIVD